MRLPRGGVAVLSCTAGVALANNYAIQPALGDVARDTGSSAAAIGLVTTAALGGCIAGFAFLLPLADRASPRRLVAGQLALLTAGLLLASRAPGLGLLLLAYVMVGAGASVSAMASTIAGRGVPEERRGAAVAGVAAGMSAGILLSRLVGGALTDALGWRGMLLAFAGLVVVCGAVAWARLPGERPEGAGSGGYLGTLAALPGLLRRHRALRLAVLSGSLWYLAFSLVWVALTVRLAQPPYGLDASAIGLYSLAGALGFAALPVAGRLGDRYSPRAVIAGSMAVAAAGAALLCTGLDRPVVTAAGLALVDAGCFTAQAANQTRVMSIDPRHSGSLSGVYLLLYFLAGALGAGAAAPLVAAGGWSAASGVVCGVLALAGTLVIYQAPAAFEQRGPGRSPVRWGAGER
ncbi:MFS transporter [Streptomyces endophyticus]|uniref:MFS transporter n=1 Tax=Streptomyces endophyticus TaxID=714166 RepID=A0ABU6F0I6_9ACTN|nr:MFS transporter [Streptomyces endophyticus]MEB8337142.1 MFS transporter [Streptomyces endophyticus]